MSYHIRLEGASCVICRQSSEPRKEEHHKIAAVIGDTSSDRPITTLPFEFPAHGHNFQYGKVYDHGKEENWRLCRVSRCPKCLASPEAFIFHTDCFSVIRRMAREQTQDKGFELGTGPPVYDTLRQIWLAGHWSRPWVKASYNSPPPPCPLPYPFPAIPAETTPSDAELELLMKKLQLLPPELSQIIMAHSRDSPLWRYVVALKWPLSIFGKLNDGSIVTLSPNDLCAWRRGRDVRTSIPQGHRRKFVRLTLDCDGIKAVDFLACRPKALCSRPPGSWYIFEKFSRLQDFHLQLQGGFLRLQPKLTTDTCVLWDTPSPPAWGTYHCFPKDGDRPQRMRSILLDQHVTGITAFCAGGLIYGIHAHRGRSSAVDTYLRLTQQLQQLVVWLYFPLGPQEVVQNILIRYRESFSVKSSNPIIMRTSHGNLHIFGQHINPSDSRHKYYRLCSRPVSQLLYGDPDSGQPILYFGASSRPLARAERVLESIKSVDCPVDRNSIYYSHASLEHVDKVQCFYDSYNEEQPIQCCIGILLEYSNQRRVALGQCRIGASQCIQVIAPTTMHVKRVAIISGLSRMVVRFTDSDRSEQFDGSGWEEIEMRGEITWWFDHGAVEIGYSPESR
ncbi:hypothetical protein B0J14DRAFT_184157 [Halenospora varia]|nr:hypothetical protein B0J14DRAFT_184157 [Halenospora varia]